MWGLQHIFTLRRNHWLDFHEGYAQVLQRNVNGLKD